MHHEKIRIDVSPEMLSFVGSGPMPAATWPSRPILLSFTDAVMAVLSVDPAPVPSDRCEGAALVFVVAGSAADRLFGGRPEVGTWHLPSALKVLVQSICHPTTAQALTETLQLAKSIELLCAVFEHRDAHLLVPVAGGSALSERDAARITIARRIVDEQWHQKLSLDAIARACGLNRGKLTRGFRSTYGCTVANALTEHRLAGAQRMLAATDLPIATIGFRCGYLNNASFARAFSRHVGVAPTRWRATRQVAA